MSAIKAKRAAIRAAKRRSFEEALEKASSNGGKSIWHLAKSAKSKSFLPPAPPSIPTLTVPTDPATTPEAKSEVLKARFFPPISAADLSDIPSFVYPPEKIYFAIITIEEIASAVSKAKPHNPLVLMAFLFSFLSCWAGHFLSISKPCFKPALPFLITHPISDAPPLLP